MAAALLNAAAISRVLSPLVPQHYLAMIDVAGVAWMAAFGMFVMVYWKILTGPSVDAVQ